MEMRIWSTVILHLKMKYYLIRLISGATVSNSLLGSLGSGGSETVDEQGQYITGKYGKTPG